MKLGVLLLVCAALVGLAVSASAIVTSIGGPLYNGWNLLAVPGVPINPAPTSVFPTGLRVDGYLYRWDAATQSQIMYDEWSPDVFGNMLLGEGYWLSVDTTVATSYSCSGLNDTDIMDIWISLPKSGFTMIGNPFSYNFPWANAKVTDGNVTVSMEVAAKTNNWLQSIAWGWDSPTQSQFDMGIPADWPTEDFLRAGNGYWVVSYQDKLALILESIP